MAKTPKREKVEQRIQETKGEIEQLNQVLAEKCRRLEELRHKQEKMKHEEELGRELANYRDEASRISQKLDIWLPVAHPHDNNRPWFGLLFLGACAGEWAVKARYRGWLPGFGGFIVRTENTTILVDPGPTTYAEMLAQGISPCDLDAIIVTHYHWDCTRDLLPIIMGAHQIYPSKETPQKRRQLQLFGDHSVIHGISRENENIKAIMAESLENCDKAERDRRQEKMNSLPDAIPGVLNFYDLMVRLGGRFSVMSMNEEYQIPPDISFRTCPSHHGVTTNKGIIPALDFRLAQPSGPGVRCVYLSDTEYHSGLADAYVENRAKPVPIDILIANVKTLDVKATPRDDGQCFTKNHLGWAGLLQLTRDFQARGLLTDKSLMILRAWGIETVTRIDPSQSLLVATPEKLGVYEAVFQTETKCRALVPGITTVDIPRSKDTFAIHHRVPPFYAPNAVRKFGTFFYCTAFIRENVIEQATLFADDPSLYVVIQGKAGTGKTELAKAIHYAANRQERLVILNGQEPNLIEHLIGSSDNSTTSAMADNSIFEMTRNGTIIIKNAEELPYLAQQQLFEYLTTRKYRPAHQREEKTISAQFILTYNRERTHRPVVQSYFRKLCCYARRIFMPDLVKHPDDIEAILDGWRRENIYGLSAMPIFNQEQLALLKACPWPGNVEQLQTAMRQLLEKKTWDIESIKREISSAEHPWPGDTHLTDPEDELDPIINAIIEILTRRGKPLTLEKIRDELVTYHPHDKAKDRKLPKSTIALRIKRLVESKKVEMIGKGPSSRYVIR